MKILDRIKEAKEKLAKAKEMKCTCSSFVLQYEGGCCCERGKQISEAYEEMQNLINEI